MKTIDPIFVMGTIHMVWADVGNLPIGVVQGLGRGKLRTVDYNSYQVELCCTVCSSEE